MKKIQKNGMILLQFPALAAYPGIRHAIFTRHGGISPAPYDSLNVAFSVGDDPATVAENRRRILRCLAVRDLVFARQVHGLGVLDCSGGTGTVFKGPQTGDALVTDRTGTGLVIQAADCQAVLIADPIRRVVANVHAGWRGSIGNIIGETVTLMKRRFGCRPSEMAAGIAPSLGPCCAEFVNYRTEIPEEFWPYKDGKDRFDFWTISRDQLIGAGLLAHRIEQSRLCTRCRTALFFSYRGERVTGRLPAVIGLAF